MPSPLLRPFRLVFLALLVPALSLAAPAADVPGSADPAGLQRFSGSRIVGYQDEAWAQIALPAAATLDANGQFTQLQQPEGRVTRLHYLGPAGKAPLEVWRNYLQALQGAGLQTKVLCERDCQRLWRAHYRLSKPRPYDGLKWAGGSVPGTGLSWYDAPSEREGRLLVGTLRGADGTPMPLLLYVSQTPSDGVEHASIVLTVVEPKAMATGQVLVDAAALGKGLQDEGRVALYGLHFDTGKSELRPDSQPQLEQMAALLKAQPTLKVFLVGHTDNAGSFDANQALSLARAQAVVAALQRAGIAPARLAAKGAASMAPVASNASDAGRAKNRRVELVVQ